jgi:cytochrome c peroxidase
MLKYVVNLAVIVIGLVSFIPGPGPSPGPGDQVELGRLLFFDPILSGDRTISCASCHKPAYAFADTTALSPGVSGRKGTRNTPSAMNIAIQDIFFWDGRARTLEEQALAPIANPVVNSDPTREHLAEAIAAFERTLETSNSPFDNWKMSGDASAVSNAVKRGFTLFGGKAKCTKCHFGSDFTQREFRNIGLFDGKTLNDSGRASLPGQEKELGKFKVPGLRNIAITAPYMHNGMFRTLREVIEFYNDPGKIVPHAINRDTVLAKPLGLTEGEKADLEAFLLSLTDKQFAGAGKSFNRQAPD